MKINSINNQQFQARIKIHPKSNEATFNTNLKEFVKKNGYIIEEYADKHGFKEISLFLGKAHASTGQGDLLFVNCGFKSSMMRFDNETTDLETRKMILQNIQMNYNLIHPKMFKQK